MLCQFKDGRWAFLQTDGSDSLIYTDENSTLMQYTGYTDSEGREIYEGDILGVPADVQYVAWAKAYSGWQWCLLGADGHIDFYGGLGGDDEALIVHTTVLGNIYENPELLK